MMVLQSFIWGAWLPLIWSYMGGPRRAAALCSRRPGDDGARLTTMNGNATRHFLAGLAGLAGLVLSSPAVERELLPPQPAGPASWSAHWIDAPDAASGTNLMFLARRSFTLSWQPERAVIYVTADSRYQLFINGTFIQRGPARSAAHHQSYDAIDVAAHLRAGPNVLAVRFHHTGLVLTYHEPTRPGLLVQLELARGADTRTIGTDRQWKIIRDPSWDSGAPRLNRWHDAANDLVDLRLRPEDWTAGTFDDTAWSAAGSLLPGRISAGSGDTQLPAVLWWPAPPADAVPQAVMPPWVALVPRDLPALVETAVRADRAVLAGRLDDAAAGALRADRPVPRFADLPAPVLPPITAPAGAPAAIPGLADYARGAAPLVLPGDGGRSSFVIFDLGEVHNGLPRLDLEGPAGAIVDVLCAPFLVNGAVDPGFLNSLHADRLVLSGRRQQWEAFYFKPARYLAVVVRAAAGPVRLHAAGVTSLAYPWVARGRFTTPENPWLEKFWQAGAQTIRVVTTDAYTDNYRERRQYSQTSYYAAQGNYAAFGDTFLQRRYLLQNAEEQEPNGALPAYAPIQDGRFMPFLDAQFFWVMGWRDYLLHSGDTATARRLLPAARRAMARLAELTGPDRLMSDPPYPYWIDHSFLDRRGANFSVNALYALALDDYAQTLDWLGETDAAPNRARAAAVRTALREKFWNPARGLFADAFVAGAQSTRFTEHANALAVAARIATPEQAAAILPQLLRPAADLVPATSLFVQWTFSALARSGRTDDGLKMLESRFGPQLAAGNGTLWEDWHLDRTNRRGKWERSSRADAQAECGLWPMSLTRWVAGLEPVSPGMREVIVSRQPVALKQISATLPTPLGALRVAWVTDESGVELAATVPPGLVARLDLLSVGLSAGQQVLLDGQPLAPSEVTGRCYVIPAGAHRLFFPSR